MLPLLVVGIIAVWWLHLTQSLTDRARYYIYAVMIYILLFFHGIHQTSLFDVAITTNLSILLFSQINDEKVIKAGVGVYASVLAYQLVLALDDGGIATDSLTTSRMALHIASVILTSRLALIIIRRRQNDTNNYESILKSLYAANERTENFMANISHELRTPINVVTGMTSVLVKEEEDPEKSKQLQAVDQAGRKLFDQIGGIIDYTELDSGKLILVNENYSITSVINDLINEINIFEKSHGLELIFDVDAELPALLTGDEARIRKIIYHLIDNAVKFTKEGGIGLGMPIVYGFVHCMNGFVKIDSREGQGTKVHVSIPQGVADPTQCIAVENAGNLCIACFLSPEKYKHPAIRDYYAEMISDMVKGLKVNLHRIAKIEDLQKVYKAYDVTHVFTGLEEYMATPSYFEEIAENTKVTVVADYSFELPAKTKLSLIRKLFYALPVAAVLNYAADAQNLNDETDYGKIQPVFEGVKVLMLIPLCLRYYTAMR